MNDPKEELALQRGIRQAEDELVTRVQEGLDNAEHHDLEEAQFRNLIRVAETTESTEVIKNFLRYQVGRDKKWGRGKASLAERIVSDIDGPLKQSALNIVKVIPDPQERVNGIWIDLIRRYLRYGARYLKYINLKED